MGVFVGVALGSGTGVEVMFSSGSERAVFVLMGIKVSVGILVRVGNALEAGALVGWAGGCGAHAFKIWIPMIKTMSFCRYDFIG